jgi:hypothetical protein
MLSRVITSCMDCRCYERPHRKQSIHTQCAIPGVRSTFVDILYIGGKVCAKAHLFARKKRARGWQVKGWEEVLVSTVSQGSRAQFSAFPHTLQMSHATVHDISWLMRCSSIHVNELCSIWKSCLWFHDTINTHAVYRSPGYPCILYISAHTVISKAKLSFMRFIRCLLKTILLRRPSPWSVNQLKHIYCD